MVKGQKTAKVQAWEKMCEKLTGPWTDEVIELFPTLSKKEKVELYLDLLEFFKPKLSRSYTDLSINQTWADINTVFESKPPTDAVES